MMGRVLAMALIQAVGLGALHIALLRGRPRPVTRFVAGGSLLCVLVGLALTSDIAWAQAGRSWTTLAWGPALAVGFFAVGLIASLAWLGVVLGLTWAWERRARRT